MRSVKDMSFLSKLFDKGESPDPIFDDPVLGAMSWSKDEEAWAGAYDGFRFAVAYERKSTPAAELLSYTREVLGDGTWLIEALESEKQRALASAPSSAKAEIEALRFGLIHFYRHKGQLRIIADVEGGGDSRSWRIEFHDRVCEGLGFDS